MEDWLQHALASLKKWRPNLQYVEDGRWVLIPDYEVPKGWNREKADVAFQIPSLPGERPYSFLVRDGIQLENGATPGSYSFPADKQVPFGSDQWGQFSWELDPWIPGNRPGEGTGMIHFVMSFSHRLKELS